MLVFQFFFDRRINFNPSLWVTGPHPFQVLALRPSAFRTPPTVRRRCCSWRRTRKRIRRRTCAAAVARRCRRNLLFARYRWPRRRKTAPPPPPVLGMDCGYCNRRHRRTPKIRRPRTWPPARRCPRAPCSVADGTASGTWTCTAKTSRRMLRRCCDRICRCRSDRRPCWTENRAHRVRRTACR